jgi:hypothetical protein
MRKSSGGKLGAMSTTSSMRTAEAERIGLEALPHPTALTKTSGAVDGVVHDSPVFDAVQAL